MKKRYLFVAVLLLSLLFMGIQPALGQGFPTVGSEEPPILPEDPDVILIQPGAGTKFIRDDVTGGDCTSIGIWDPTTKTCKLTIDLSETIQIDSDGITLDGQDHTISGPGWGYGVYLYGRTGVTIKNVTVQRFSFGIYLYSSSNNTLTGNTALKNGTGMRLLYSSGNILLDNTIAENYHGLAVTYSDGNKLSGNSVTNSDFGGISFRLSEGNTLSANVMAGNSWNFYVNGLFAKEFVHSVDTSNTVDGRPIFYVVDQDGITIDASSNAGYVGVVRSTNVVVRDLTLSNNGQGVLFACTTNSAIENVHVSDNRLGIHLIFSDGNSVTGNTASGNDMGIAVDFSDANTIAENTATDNLRAGIGLLSGADRNLITSNTAIGNTFGIGVQSSNLNTVADNYVFDNDFGIRVGYIGGTQDIFFAGGDENDLKHNTVEGNGVGIKASDSDGTVVEENTVIGSALEGILLFSSGASDIKRNEISLNGIGIKLDRSDNNTVRFNNLIGNAECVVEEESSSNRFVQNECSL